MTRDVSFKEVKLPELAVLENEPILPREVYEQRWARLRERMEQTGLGTVVVYADREHPAGSLYLTGFDPLGSRKPSSSLVWLVRSVLSPATSPCPWSPTVDWT